MHAADWAIADYGMEELLVPAFDQVTTAPGPLAVFRPYPMKWDTLLVRADPPTRNWRVVRWTANRRAILESRIHSTRAVGAAIAKARRPPGVWLQMSTATIYAHRYDAPNDEATGLIGGAEHDAPATWHFSIDLARAWEAAVGASETPSTRKVLQLTSCERSRGSSPMTTWMAR